MDIDFNYDEILMGGCSIDATGEPLTKEAIEQAKRADAVLLGSIGGDAKTSPWYKLPPAKRPEAGLLKIRKELGLFANLRPAYLYDQLREACPLKEATGEKGFDMLIMRELTGGLYFGDRFTKEEDGELVAEEDAVIQLDSCGEEAFELMIRMTQIIEEAYPMVMKELWA